MITLKPSLGSYIIELREKVEAIESEMRKNAGKAGKHYRHLDGIEPGSGPRAMEAMAQNRELKPKLVEALDALGHTYQQKGDADSSKYYFARAKAERK